jgi:hypothetical protein
MTKTKLNIETNEGKVHFDFGSVDKKGRKVGAFIHTSTREYVPYVEGDNCWYRDNKDVGTYFTFRPHLTKNGVSFGAYQDHRYFKTEAERQESIEAYLANAKKRHG